MFTVPLPTLIGEQMICCDPQQVKSQAGADDIGNGIHSAHFMEMNLLQGLLMDRRFGLGQLLEHGRWS